jgi:hypothetical protein
VDQLLDPAPVVEKFGSALSVGQDKTYAGPAQVPGNLAQIDEEVVRHLDEEIVSPVCDAQQFSTLPGGFEVRPDQDLGAGGDGERDVLLAQCLGELPDTFSDELRSDGAPAVVLVSQGGGQSDALAVGDSAHLQGLLVRAWPIVHSGQEMAVHVNQGDHGALKRVKRSRTAGERGCVNGRITK